MKCTIGLRIAAIQFLVFSIVLFFCVPVSHAHRVIIFAWTEGDTVHTVSKFPGAGKVSGSPVLVCDGAGNRLLEGKTDDKGEFSFKIPKNAPLKIVLQAGAGHKGEWNLSGEEISAALGKKEFVPAPRKSPAAVSGINDFQANAQSGASASMDDQRIESIVEKIMDRKLAPIMTILADLHDPGPSLNDIFGGIGYILGLFGVAAYVASRKK